MLLIYVISLRETWCYPNSVGFQWKVLFIALWYIYIKAHQSKAVSVYCMVYAINNVIFSQSVANGLSFISHFSFDRKKLIFRTKTNEKKSNQFYHKIQNIHWIDTECICHMLKHKMHTIVFYLKICVCCIFTWFSIEKWCSFFLCYHGDAHCTVCIHIRVSSYLKEIIKLLEITCSFFYFSLLQQRWLFPEQ